MDIEKYNEILNFCSGYLNSDIKDYYVNLANIYQTNNKTHFIYNQQLYLKLGFNTKYIIFELINDGLQNEFLKGEIHLIKHLSEFLIQSNDTYQLYYEVSKKTFIVNIPKEAPTYKPNGSIGPKSVEYLYKIGFRLVSVSGDGNCFWRSISKILFGDENKYRDIKKVVYSFFESNNSKFNKWLKFGDYTPDEDDKLSHEFSIKKILERLDWKYSEWTKQTEVFLTAMCLKRKIYIINETKSVLHIEYCPENDLYSPLYLYNDGNAHYNPFIRPNNYYIDIHPRDSEFQIYYEKDL